MLRSFVDALHLDSKLTFWHVSLVKDVHSQIEGNEGGCNRVSEGRLMRKAIELLVDAFEQNPTMFDEQEFSLDMRKPPAFAPAVQAEDFMKRAGSLSGDSSALRRVSEGRDTE